MDISVRLTYSKAILALAAISLAAFFSYVYYPGYNYWDIGSQYHQALQGKYTDWHPPIIAFLWHYAMLITNSPSILYISLIFAVYMAFYNLLKPFKLYISLPALILLSIFPLFGAQFGLAWKDSFLADIVFLVASIFVLHIIEGCPFTKTEKVICAVLLALATLARANAPFITAPLFIYMFAGWSFRLKPIIYSVCLALIFIICSAPINHKILGAKNDHAIVSLQIFNLAGISFRLHKNFIPGDWTKEQDDRIIGCYNDKWWDSYASWAQPDKCSFVFSGINRNHLDKIWLQTIARHPFAYAEHRGRHFNQLMKFGENEKPDMPFFPLKPGYEGNPNEAIYHVYDAYAAFITKYPHQIWFYGFFWLAIAIGFLIATAPGAEPADRLINCLAVSTIFYYGAYLIISVASQFRYLLPGCYLIIAAIILAIYSIYQQGGVKNLTKYQKAGAATAASIIILGVIL